MDSEERRNFVREWEAIIPQVLHLCRRMGGSADRGDEIFQRTAMRVLQKFNGYRGQAFLLTWASSIVRHETDRLFRQEIMEGRRRASVALDALTKLEQKTTDSSGAQRQAAILSAAARTAAETGWLSKVEGKVVLARLDNPEASWGEIGGLHSLSANACAAAHCRAILGLRVYVFTHCPELLGGVKAIEAAFLPAESFADDPLRPDEHMAFLQIILKGTRGYRRRGWREALRSACLKVSRRLEIDE